MKIKRANGSRSTPDLPAGMAIVALTLALAGILLFTLPTEATNGDPQAIPHSHTAAINPATAAELAEAMDVPAGDIVSATIGDSDPDGVAVADEPLAYFPTRGDTFTVLANGLAASADDPDTNNDEAYRRGDEIDDVSAVLEGLNTSLLDDLVQLTLELEAPAAMTCLSFDFAFFSEEWPDFAGLEFGEFNDTFIAELGPPGEASTFTIPGLKVVAPNNIATDPDGEALTINSEFGFDPEDPNPDTGTTYDGVSDLLRAKAPVTPGDVVEIVFSVIDVGDSDLDSAVFLDNFRWTAEGGGPCPQETEMLTSPPLRPAENRPPPGTDGAPVNGEGTGETADSERSVSEPGDSLPNGGGAPPSPGGTPALMILIGGSLIATGLAALTLPRFRSTPRR